MAKAQTNERAFEESIHAHLLAHGYSAASNSDFDFATARDGFDRSRAIFPGVFMDFVRATQPTLITALQKLHGASTDSIIIDDLVKAMDMRGSLDVIRHGFKCFGKQIEAAYFKPASKLNPETLALYGENIFTATRQIHYSIANENSLDLLFALNGIPFATAELKNPMSGQKAWDARKQYEKDRDPREVIFEFKRRTLVHFAVDPDLVYMTTRLAGSSTYWLPLNKGHNNGAGNPENPHGQRTAYLWESIWQRDSLLDILGRFVHLEIDERRVGGKTYKKERMIFPRYHQFDAVQKLEAHAKSNGAGQNYLVQHSAGSGKSNSIGWLAHRLASLHDDEDQKTFHSVIVVTDRVVLDKQLQDTIYQFEHKHGVVEKIETDSTQLADAVTRGVPIIITTIQKFPFILDKTGDLTGRRFAVIVDEAHSSQSGETAADLRGVLASGHITAQAKAEAEEGGLADYEEEVLREVKRRGHQPNISFFAFTATPKYKTLEMFGTPDTTGEPKPFHLYSMRQAIEEHFILDVLSHYTTYKAFFGLVKAAGEDQRVEKRQAAKALARFMSLHPHNIEQKTQVMVEHFMQVTRHKIGEKAKAMVVTASRLAAVRYKQSFDKYIREKKYPIKSLVAFSGTVIDDIDASKSYTEGGMNLGICGKGLPEQFDTEEFQVLLVAEKFQTGFDQPLLHTMYVDKKLEGVHAVQTLSRLNRVHPGKEDTFVLDFVNEREQILKAFQPYYEEPAVGERADAAQLYALTAQLDATGIYHSDEIDAFTAVYFKPKPTQSAADHGAIEAILNKAVTRFRIYRDELRGTVSESEFKQQKAEAQEEFRGQLQAFRNLYSFLSQIIPYQDSDLEKHYTYSRYLLKKLPRMNDGPRYEFDDDVALQYYRLQMISKGSIVLQPGGGGMLDGPTSMGTGAPRREEIELSRLIEIINERFGTDFKLADQLFLDSVREQAASDEGLRQAALANTLDNFKHVFGKALETMFIDRMGQNEEIFAKFMDDTNFRKLVEEHLRKQVYDQIRAGAA